jgi:hypothetical protein
MDRFIHHEFINTEILEIFNYSLNFAGDGNEAKIAHLMLRLV